MTEDPVETAHRIAAHLTTLLPEDMREAGYRFWFDDTPLEVSKDHDQAEAEATRADAE
jgi:hypothetical protein